MKRILSLMLMAWAAAAWAAEDGDYVPTPRDEAVAALAGKRTEAEVLRAELGTKTQERDTEAKHEEYARTQLDEIRALDAQNQASGQGGIGPGGRGSGPYYEWIANMAKSIALGDAAAKRITEINARLKALEGEIKQAKDNLLRLTGPPGKGNRSNLRPENNPRPPTPRPTGGDCGKHPL